MPDHGVRSQSTNTQAGHTNLKNRPFHTRVRGGLVQGIKQQRGSQDPTRVVAQLKMMIKQQNIKRIKLENNNGSIKNTNKTYA
jgi:hypothetical protein